MAVANTSTTKTSVPSGKGTAPSSEAAEASDCEVEEGHTWPVVNTAPKSNIENMVDRTDYGSPEGCVHSPPFTGEQILGNVRLPTGNTHTPPLPTLSTECDADLTVGRPPLHRMERFSSHAKMRYRNLGQQSPQWPHVAHGRCPRRVLS